MLGAFLAMLELHKMQCMLYIYNKHFFFQANFHSLDDYIAYEYLAKVSVPQAPIAQGQPRTITLSFPVGSGVRTPGFYRFIYFSQPNNDVRSVLGTFLFNHQNLSTTIIC